MSFNVDKVCLVYVHGDTHNFEVESIFNSQCYGDKMCAILDVRHPSLSLITLTIMNCCNLLGMKTSSFS